MRTLKWLLFTTLIALTFCVSATSAVAEERQGENRDLAAQNEQSAKRSATQAKEACLGLIAVELPPPLAYHLREVLGNGRGVLVANVTPNLPAAKGGLRAHDILITYDGHDLYSSAQLVKLVRHDRPGREVTIGYIRGGKADEVVVQLESLPGRHAWRHNFRGSPEKSIEATADVAPAGKPSDWKLESFTCRHDGEEFNVEVKVRDSGERISRVYQGSAEEVQRAIQDDVVLHQDTRSRLSELFRRHSRLTEDRGVLNQLPTGKWLSGLGKWLDWATESAGRIDVQKNDRQD